MSGHSKWKKIKRQKGAQDLKKGNLFTKLGQAITIAVKEGGGENPDMNFMLRIALDKAKEANMPKDTIERAVMKGKGVTDNGELERVTYDLSGKKGIAMIVDCLTDNKNRTVAELRKIAEEADLAIASGSASWLFKQRGRIYIEPYKVRKIEKKGKIQEVYDEMDSEDLMLDIMEISGVVDVLKENIVDEEGRRLRVITVFTNRSNLNSVYDLLMSKQLKVLKAEMARVPISVLSLKTEEKERFSKVKQDLEENEDVVSVWTNINLQ